VPGNEIMKDDSVRNGNDEWGSDSDGVGDMIEQR
jgi:hypothetical protein